MIGHPRFLSVEDVLKLHAIAIEDQGGDPTIRDRGLLESAVAMPSQQFGGAYLHDDIPAMAAAYAFHICKNHPFIDGNKRAATAAMIAFLSDNGWVFDAHIDDAEATILRLASGELDKATFTDWARAAMREKPRLELRDFFRRLNWNDVFELAEAVVRANSETEAAATILDARCDIPLIEQLEHLRDRANEELSESTRLGDAEKAAALEKRRAYFNSMFVLLVAIHRIAEDQGYEW